MQPITLNLFDEQPAPAPITAAIIASTPAPEPLPRVEEHDTTHGPRFTVRVSSPVVEDGILQGEYLTRAEAEAAPEMQGDNTGQEPAQEPASDDSEGEEADPTKAARVHRYKARRAARVARYEARAARASQNSDQAYQRSSALVAHIPFGQPILVGHHSESRHRNTLKRSRAAMDKSCEEAKRAEYWQGRAASAESNRAIFSDDPEAAEKISEKIARLEARQAAMKAINAKVRKAKINRDTPDAAAKLREILDDAEAEAVVRASPHWGNAIEFPAYLLTNNNANIRRLKQRAAQLEKLEATPTTETEAGAVRILDNAEENRLQIFFPGKPSETVRKYLKSHGFRWSPSAEAWQAYRSTGATYHAGKAAELHNSEGSD